MTRRNATPVWLHPQEDMVKDCLIAPDNGARYVDGEASEGMRHRLHKMRCNSTITEENP
jgi:hypothetical protein